MFTFTKPQRFSIKYGLYIDMYEYFDKKRWVRSDARGQYIKIQFFDI
jgi:hypothetical protein